MAFCHKCGKELMAGFDFCPHCGTKALDLTQTAAKPAQATSAQTPAAPQPVQQQTNTPPPQPVSRPQPQPTTSQTASKANTTPTKKPNKVNVQGGRYVGKKWFIKFAYKTYTTDVEFFGERMVLSQGTGFASVGYQTPTAIDYPAIYSVDTARKLSVPNVIFAIIAAIMGLMVAQQSPGIMVGAFVIAAIVFFIGKTAVVSIKHSGGEYLVPTEFYSDAEQLRDKINMAKNQSRG